MKYAIISGGGGLKTHLQHIEDQKFIERIKIDVRNGIIQEFRWEMTWRERPSLAKRYHLIPHVCPMAELQKKDGGAPTLKQFNGLLLLDVKPVVGQAAQDEVKRRAMALPSTQAAFVGASGQSVKLLVKVARKNGVLPQTESEVNRLYEQAHDELLPVYQALLNPYAIVPDCRGAMHAFLMPFDPTPMVNDSAMPFVVGEKYRQTDVYDHEVSEMYQRVVMYAVEAAMEDTGRKSDAPWDEDFVVRVVVRLRDKQMPREDAFGQMERQMWMLGKEFSKDRLRVIVDSVYDGKEDELANGASGKSGRGVGESLMNVVIKTLEERYQFRLNIFMGYTEYRSNKSQNSRWEPVDDRVMNELAIQMNQVNPKIWLNDVKMYINSTRIPSYNVVEEYMYSLRGKWDGIDRIGQLAKTVPTDTPKWPEWFHKWFLAMVAQWLQLDRKFGNSIVPLLISQQGYHKSTFCRSLLPPELVKWGYKDNMSVAEERPVYQAMAQRLLINLDEFNRISPKKQEGFLKFIITMPKVSVKRPYARIEEEMPRMASFIATTNQVDVLADPTGSRRFVGIYINGDIDTDSPINYDQLYAQALYELEEADPKKRISYYFNEAETKEVIQHNRQFQIRSDALSVFYDYFDVAANESEGVWMSANQILEEIKDCSVSVRKNAPSLNKFARELRGMPDLKQKQKRDNVYYLVKKLG